MSDDLETPAPPYLHLVRRKHPWRRQLYIKGRNMTVRQLVGHVRANDMNYEEAALDLDLPVEAIKEAFHYYWGNKEVIEADQNHEEGVRMRGIASKLVGLTEQEAKAMCEENGLIFRVVSEDGQDSLVTMEVRPNRVNVEVSGGKVVAIKSVG